MKLTRMPAVLMIALGFSGCSTTARDGHKAQAWPKKVSLSDMRVASIHLQDLFEPLDSKVLSELGNNPDDTVAIHAVWELSKAKPAEIPRFLKKFKSISHTTPPLWWRKLIEGVRVYEGNCHYVPNVSTYAIDEEVRISDGDLEFTAKPGIAGFSYPVVVSDKNNPGETTTVQVWAVGRMLLAGVGVHRMEMTVEDDVLFVFGAESHGAYAEAFRLPHGEPIFRFSICYWFNFSEKWKKTKSSGAERN